MVSETGRDHRSAYGEAVERLVVASLALCSAVDTARAVEARAMSPSIEPWYAEFDRALGDVAALARALAVANRGSRRSD